MGIFQLVNKDTYQAWDSFYHEKDNSIDAIYIGASNVFPFWSAPMSWHQYGQTIYPLSTAGMPSWCIKYAVIEARKTQPNALYIICINTLKSTSFDESTMHYFFDYMHLSKNKIDAINDLCARKGIKGADKLEFYFRFIRFHSRWNSLVSSDFYKKNDGVKNAITWKKAFENVTDVTKSYCVTENTIPISDAQKEVLDNLIDYLKENNVNTLFTISPQALKDENIIGQFNTIKEYLKENGYDTLDMLNNCSDTGIQTTSDFYNAKHVNVHGCLKLTNYFGTYLNKRYGFTDKRGNPEYESWDRSYEIYLNMIDEYTLGFERENNTRDYSLTQPEIKKVSTVEKGINITWGAVNGADAYEIYRRYKPGDSYTEWEKIGEVSEDALSFLDKSPKKEISSFYTVVPLKYNDNDVSYGNFNYTGKSSIFYISAPELDSLTVNDNKVTISWKQVKGADGYNVYRKINNQSYVRIGTTKSNTLTYEDIYIQKELPYIYTVTAFYNDNNSEKKESSYNTTGLLYNEYGLSSPSLNLTTGDQGNITLNWDTIKGANCYTLYQRNGNSEWTIVNDSINAATTSYEIGVPTSGSEFKLAAVIVHGKDRYEYYSEILSVNDKIGGLE